MKMHLFTECEDGFYNSSCDLQCGKCKANTACDKMNGSCPDGCVDSYEPPFCTGVSSVFLIKGKITMPKNLWYTVKFDF